MIKQLKVIALFIAILFAQNGAAITLTEASVKRFIAESDAAIIPFDVQKLATFLSDSVKITININVLGQKQVLRPSKAVYLEMVKRGRALVSDYKFSKSNLNILIKGKKAFVRVKVMESMKQQGRRVKSKTDEEYTIEVVAGKLQITELAAYTNL